MRSWARRACLALLLAVAVAALALAYDSAVGWALLLLAPAALVVPALRLPPRLRTALIWSSRALIAAVPIVDRDGGLPVGVALAVLAAAFLCDERAFSAGRAFLPAVLGVLLAAAHVPDATHLTGLAWLATIIVAAWLVLAPEAGGLSVRRVAAVLLFALATVALGQGLIVFLPWAQPHVEEAAYPLIRGATDDAGFAIGARLGDIESLALSRRVILRMWSDAPRKLRLGVHTRFDGRRWSRSRYPDVRPLPPAALLAAVPAWADDVPGRWYGAVPHAPAGRRFARFLLAEHTFGVLPAPAGVDAARMRPEPVRLDETGILVSPPARPQTYAVRYREVAGPEPPGQIADPECLTLPPRLDPRLRDLARRLGDGAGSAREKIDRTVLYLQTNLRYSLDVGRWSTSDPLSEFLFEKKKGYCEYFATAAVVLLRLEGVPARYVNGFHVRPSNRIGDHYLVRASDAHAWAEAFVPEAGWVEVDATPPDSAEGHSAVPSAFEEVLESLRTRGAELAARLREEGWRALGRLFPRRARAVLVQSALVLAVGAGLAALARAIRRLRRTARAEHAPPSAPAAAEVVRCLRRVEAIWERLGYARPPHRALLEHATAVPVEAAVPELREVGIAVARCFYRDAYGGERVPAEEVAALAARLDAVSVRMTTQERDRSPSP